MFGSKSNIDVRTAKERQDSGATVLDVRTKPEWRQGHVPKAVHVSLDSLVQRTGWIEKSFGDTQILVICRSGNRSSRAAAQLRRSGLDAVNVKGGMIAWGKAHLPITRK